MAEFLDKVTIQTPSKHFRDFDLSCMHLTTAGFMSPSIVYAKEFPEAKIRCNLKSYSRLQPLLKPVLGSVQVHNRAFWVPFRVVWDPFESFITDSPYNTSSGSGIINAVPTIKNSVFTSLFVTGGYHSAYTSVVSSGSYDFTYNSSRYKFTQKGRFAFKILRQLGYYPQFNANIGDYDMSCLPLLCFAKLFLDWYYPAQYAHTGDAGNIDGMFHRQFRYDMSMADLHAIIGFTYRTYYKNDYFTAAWDSPVAPTIDAGSIDIQIPDITISSANRGLVKQAGASENNPYKGTPYVNVGKLGLTQYLDDSLKALTNYVKRHQLVGARVLDRYLADFSVSLDAAKLKRSIYVGSQSFPIQFSDVMSNSDTSDAVLGQYAGKGVAYDGAGNFEYDTKEFGMFVIINDVAPDVAYYQGIDRNVFHISKTDFLLNEFERLGTQPVLSVEAAACMGDDEEVEVGDIFGFLPRYSEYKVGRDLITGLFDYDSVNVGLSSWSTMRTLDYNAVHSIGFMRGDDSYQYNRIFYGDSYQGNTEIDNFIFVHRINIKVAMRAMPMYDTYDFDEDEGMEIKMQANGVQV